MKNRITLFGIVLIVNIMYKIISKMAKFKCPMCDEGYAHTSGSIPNSNEWLLISDVAYDQLGETIDTKKLYSRMQHMFRCSDPCCGCVAIFELGLGNDPMWYRAC